MTAVPGGLLGRIRDSIDHRCFARAVDLCRLGLNRLPSADVAEALCGLRAEAEAGLHPAPAARSTCVDFLRGCEAFGRGEFGAAATLLRKAVSAEPDNAEAHTYLGQALIATGQLADGWPEHEWRFRLPWGTPRAMAVPQWDGTPMPGRTLLLWDEQGLGDILQFVRFARVAGEVSKARVIFHGRPRLCRLLGRCAGLAAAIPRMHDFPRPHAHASVMSLPAILGVGSAFEPAPYLSAEPGLVGIWRERLAHLPGPRIGLVWQGTPGYYNDRQRSFPIETYLPLLRAFGGRASFVSLQKGFGAEQLGRLPDDVPVHQFGSLLDGGEDGFVDTAAVMAHLDLVITVDTAVAHLAGALGVRVWIALGHGPDWRWGERSETTPFYPRARLFRRAADERWDDVMGRIGASLAGGGAEGVTS
jgi:hypothetical protein